MERILEFSKHAENFQNAFYKFSACILNHFIFCFSTAYVTLLLSIHHQKFLRFHLYSYYTDELHRSS